MTENKRSDIYLFDAHALCYRAFYAIRGLTSSYGMPTGAVLGFINTVNRILREHEPEHVVIAFDSKEPTKRHKLYEEYKAHREPMPEDLVQQMPFIKKFVRAKNFLVCQKPGYEADDIIAVLAQQASEKGLDTTIVTGDKDALQLISENLRILSPGKKGEKIYDAEKVEEKFGVRPDQILEFMSLVGDKSDNIPGVKGIGKVTAGKLIREFGTVKNIYKNLDNISSKSIRKKLDQGRESAELSRSLIEPDMDVPVELDLDKALLSDPTKEDLIELYTKLEFKKMLSGLLSEGDIEKRNYMVADSGFKVEKYLEGLAKNKVLSVSPDFSGENGSLRGAAFSYKAFEALYIPFRRDDLAGIVTGLLEDRATSKVVYNAKEILKSFEAQEMTFLGYDFDIMLADYIADPGISGRSLSAITERRLSRKLVQRKDNKVQTRKDLFDAYEPEKSSAEKHNERADMVFRLYKQLSKELKEKDLLDLFQDIEMPLVPVLADMERTGVGIDLEHLRESADNFEHKLHDLTEEIHELAGKKFNINSPKQLQEILFEKLELPPGRRTKTGFSTDEAVLEGLSSEHRIPKLLLEYRHLNKLKTTYYDAIIELTDKNTGRLHSKFNQAVTATGRLSSSEPNIQNIPIRTDLGRRIRKAFIPPFDDHVLVAADYSQIELRILAHLSADRTLIEAFQSGKDVHEFTASKIFECDVKDVTKQMRRVAKTVNFGIVYGMGKNALASDLGITTDEAGKFIEAYFNRYSSVRSYMDGTIRFARENGYVSTLMKRRRYLPEINSNNQRIRSFAERTAVNTPVQGSAADIIKLAMILFHDKIKKTSCKIIMQVHDELLLSVSEEEVDKRAEQLKNIMENVVKLKVKLEVDLETGKNWYDMRKLSI